MRQRIAIAATLAALALAGSSAGPAQAAPKGGGSGGTTCTYKDGSKAQPGDEMKQTQTTRVKGRRFVSTSSLICGEDGQWHVVL